MTTLTLHRLSPSHRGACQCAPSPRALQTIVARVLARYVLARCVLARCVLAVLVLASTRPTGAQAGDIEKVVTHNPRWAPIHQVFNQGEMEDGYFRINLPRSDLQVRIADDALSPDFEFTSYIGFAPMGARNVLAMGEIILLQTEIPAVLAEAHRQGIRVTAVHNHLIDETPRIMYVHVMAEGAPAAVAAKLRSVFAKSATPLDPPKHEPSVVDWSAIDAVLGKHSEAEGRVAEYVFPRTEHLRVHGMAVKSTGVLETASEVVFQQLDGGRVASTGELYLLASEVETVVRTLDEHGLHITALHTHMLDDGPPHYWVHWYATGDGPTLARGVAAALAHMSSARKAVAAE